MTAHTPGPWVIDNRSHYDWPAGGHQKPLQLGAVVAECPTAFGGHTIRAPHTIGKPCPTKDAMDAEGLANAHLVKAAPELLAAMEAILQWGDSHGGYIPQGLEGAAEQAVADARGRGGR